MSTLRELTPHVAQCRLRKTCSATAVTQSLLHSGIPARTARPPVTRPANSCRLRVRQGGSDASVTGAGRCRRTSRRPAGVGSPAAPDRGPLGCRTPYTGPVGSSDRSPPSESSPTACRGSPTPLSGRMLDFRADSGQRAMGPRLTHFLDDHRTGMTMHALTGYLDFKAEERDQTIAALEESPHEAAGMTAASTTGGPRISSKPAGSAPSSAGSRRRPSRPTRPSRTSTSSWTATCPASPAPTPTC